MQSEAIDQLAAALAKAQAEVENASKNSVNPHYKSKYSDLAEVLNTVRPVLAKHELSVVQSPSFLDGLAHVETTLMHSSGQWIRGICSAPLSKSDAQGVGACVTYLRRYSLAGFAGIAQEDDDGNTASGKAAVIPAKAQAQDVPIDQEIVTKLDAAQSLPELAALWTSIPQAERSKYTALKDAAKKRLAGGAQ